MHQALLSEEIKKEQGMLWEEAAGSALGFCHFFFSFFGLAPAFFAFVSQRLLCWMSDHRSQAQNELPRGDISAPKSSKQDEPLDLTFGEVQFLFPAPNQQPAFAAFTTDTSKVAF